ncbi:carbonic anhydrase 1-like isoform X2 [Belonocnema kinseyi]|uniref:carbonic anhydrase 1-like isoform X2 n=1 Tax=Belonocnema kinseyi TaxID=2817044 RepID=UPI00143D198C|nr:carbonic anhydrase 1-like isoform X2 [Belonocnema kinseyi]
MNHCYLLMAILNGLHSGANSYTFKDASKWKDEYPDCGGKNQAPILLRPREMKVKNDYVLKFINHDKKPTSMKIKNDGHFVQVTGVWPGAVPSIIGGPLNNEYKFDRVDFFWGQSDTEGSLHKIADYETGEPNGYALENHLNYYNRKYDTFEDARKESDGIAVVCLIYKIGTGNSSLKPFEKILGKIQPINSTEKVSPFPLSDMNLATVSLYFTYKGSLVIPPCTDSVNWIISQYIQNVTEKEVNLFRKIHLEGGDKTNIRPIQQQNKRDVYYLEVKAE